jgi:RNA polymerase sigma factor (sigma-70 family)
MFQPFDDFIKERNAFVEFIRKKHHKSLLAIALTECRRFRYDDSHAKEVLQEFYMKCMLKFRFVKKQYDELGPKYLTGIIHKQFLDMSRHNKSLGRKKEGFKLRTPVEIDINHYNPDSHFDEYKQVMRKHLNNDDCLMITRHVEGYKHAEIGRELNLSEGNINVRISRAKKILAKILKEKE